MKLTEQQRTEKRQRDALQHICNRLMSGINFGSIKTWRDVYVTSGIDAATIASTYTNASELVTFTALKKYCDELKVKLEENIRIRSVTESIKKDLQERPPIESPVTELQPIKEPNEDYGLIPSPNEKAYLYWFQKKACAELLKGFGIS